GKGLRLLGMVVLFLSYLEVRCQDKVHQEEWKVSQVGENCTITCRYETANFYSLHWYRQYLGEKPTYLFQIVSDKVRQEPNFSAELDKKNRSSQLHVTSVEFGNAATYFCALEAQ
uniref:T cell receptor alpha variable 39 n=1 Tax=Anolis carolinensis TaxID=28377 RepID=A0A803U1I7_ANOCA